MYVNVLCLLNLNRKSVFSFHQMNMAKSSKFVFTIILFGENIYKDVQKKLGLDLIKPWQTLGCCGSQSHDSI